MIIWINGAYGSGKSATAEKIQELIPGSLLFDAEAVGNAVRDNLETVDYHVEFPDYPIWRDFVVKLVTEMSRHTDKHILIPMTVMKEEYIQEIATAFDKNTLPFLHFVLDVDNQLIGERIIKRGEEPDCWCYEQIDRCVELLQDLSGIHIDGTKALDDVAQTIISHIA